MKEAEKLIAISATGSKKKTTLGGEPGTKYRMLTVTAFVGRDRRNNAIVTATCDCGNKWNGLLSSLRSGRTVSCGCYGKTHAIKSDGINVRMKSEYQIWKALRGRCKNPKNKDYPSYGGRGITVCERWGLFENFVADMGARPSANHSIDRHPNNDGNYEPGNCRWASATDQANNRRTNVWLSLNGVRLLQKEVALRLGTVQSVILRRVALTKAEGRKSFVCKDNTIVIL